MLYLEQAMQNPNQLVVLAIPETKDGSTSYTSISTYLSGEFQLGASAEYESAFAAFENSSIANKAGAITAGIEALSGIGAMVSDKIDGWRFGNILTRAIRWRDSKVSSFSLPINLINYKGNDIRVDMKTLYGAVLPAEANMLMLRPPMGYNPKSEILTSGNGLVSLKIGEWFFARKLIITDVNFAISRETDKSGLPLFATGTITLSPATLVEKSEFEKWFV